MISNIAIDAEFLFTNMRLGLLAIGSLSVELYSIVPENVSAIGLN